MECFAAAAVVVYMAELQVPEQAISLILKIWHVLSSESTVASLFKKNLK